jgi:glutathione synthase/RimK-type ligase-like ATP-grasp enzyme
VTVLLATSADWPDGEPGAGALDAALEDRGIEACWVRWDDDSVDWRAADLVAVRSTWDYMARPGEFLTWAEKVEAGSRLLNGAAAFAWNMDKIYLTTLGDLPVVPTRPAADAAELAREVTGFGVAVVKPRIGAGGAGVLVVDDPADPRLGRVVQDVPGLPPARGPWIVQPLVGSVRTEGETSVFVLDGRAVSQVDKVPGVGEIRVHDYLGGASRPVPMREEAAALAVRAIDLAGRRLGRPLDYARVDLLRLVDGVLAVSEIEATEPGLYLDVLPSNAGPFADLVAARLG